MAALATPEDVVADLGRPLSETEAARVEHLLLKASVLVVGHLGCDPTGGDGTVPDAARLVVAGMVARLFLQESQAGPGGAPIGVQSTSVTTGPFGNSTTFQAGSNSGAPWLSSSDKVALRPIDCNQTAFSVDTAPGGTDARHSPWCSINDYANAPYWRAYCTCGASIAGYPLYEEDPR